MGCICGLAAWLVKYILFFANVLFVLSGIAIIAVGAMAQASFVEYEELLHGLFSGTAVAVIVIGCLIFVIAFCGCCGAISENRCMLMTYGTLLLCILLAQIGIGIWALSTPAASESLVNSQMKDFWREEYKDQQSEIFDHLQSELKCCGVDSAKDYAEIFPTPFQLPASCCPSGAPEKLCLSVSPLSYNTGCYVKLTEYIDSSVQVIGIVAICVAAAEVLAAVFAFCLAGHIKKK